MSQKTPLDSSNTSNSLAMHTEPVSVEVADAELDAVVPAALYLIPTPISDAPLGEVLPEYNLHILKGIRYFIVENIRSARRFIKRAWPGADISQLSFYVLNRHTDPAEVSGFLEPLRRGEAVGVMSDAGCPAVADPGALPVAIAQREGLKVKTLVGPSSILMSLMGSGFSGQGFAFHGYLPIEDAERREALRMLENESRRRDMTQIFIETPYRNERMLSFLASNLYPDTRICIACDITDPGQEQILTRKVSEWNSLLASKNRTPEFDKRPAIFLIYAGMEESVQQTKNKKGDFRVNPHNSFNNKNRDNKKRRK